MATPKENSYIEAFNSILEPDVIGGLNLTSTASALRYEAKETLQRYISITTIIGFTAQLGL